MAMNRTAKAIGGIVLIGVAVGIASGWIWSSTATAQATIGEPIDAVEIDNDSGDVSVHVGDVTRTVVKQRFSYRFDRPGDAFDVDNGVLKLDDCGWWCSVDYEVVVPEGTKVTGKIDSGNLSLVGVAGAEVEADSGTIELRDIAGPVIVDADSGDIEGSGLTGPVTAKVDSGDLELQLTRPNDVTAEVDSGNIELTVPDGQYLVEGDTDSGERQIDVGQSPDAGHRLLLDTDSGDVTVRPAG